MGVVAAVLVVTGTFGSNNDETTPAAGESTTTETTTPATTETTTTETTTTSPTYSYPSTTESGVTTPPGYSPDPTDTIANEIRTTDVGACIHREANGSQLTTFYRTACDSSAATDRVYRRTDNTGDCDGNWVQIGPSAYYSGTVVLCLNRL